MSAHVLLNLFDKLEERDKLRGLLSILSLFCSKFDEPSYREPHCFPF